MRIRTAVCTALAVVVMLTVPLLGQNKGPGGEKGKGRGFRMLAGPVVSISATELVIETYKRPAKEGDKPTKANVKIKLDSATKYVNIGTGSKSQVAVGVTGAIVCSGSTARGVGVYKKCTVAQAGPVLGALMMNTMFRSHQESDKRESMKMTAGTFTKTSPITVAGKDREGKAVSVAGTPSASTKYFKASDIQRTAIKKGQFAAISPKGEVKEGQTVTAAMVTTMPAPPPRTGGRPEGKK
ncbi:MAG: hypothetical protein IT204_04975 [Fimbriimonadaceae bacterium]|nr:hypothetical protein [Fimbriimonadaceae bacterium]